MLINQISSNSNVLDLASGKGQDLGRYVKKPINKLLLMEYDKTAMLELINRKYSLVKQFVGAPLTAPFVVCIGTYHHLKLFTEWRCYKPGFYRKRKNCDFAEVILFV